MRENRGLILVIILDSIQQRTLDKLYLLTSVGRLILPNFAKASKLLA